MTIGLVGRKAGMTRVFTDSGDAQPVTVIEALPNRILQVKDSKADGYRAVQVTFASRRASRLTKPVAGHYAKPGVIPGELRVPAVTGYLRTANLRRREHAVVPDDRRRAAEPGQRDLPGDVLRRTPRGREARFGGHAVTGRSAPLRPVPRRQLGRGQDEACGTRQHGPQRCAARRSLG